MSTHTSAVPVALTAARATVAPAMRAATAKLSPAVRRVVEYHFGWIDADGVPASGSGGKALRPALALLSAQAAGAAPDRGVPAAVAVEFVHNFSLLHDDIMDGDTERRHRPTAWTVFGTAAAILAGDGLLVASVSTLLDAPEEWTGSAAVSLMTATQRLITGQADDLSFERRDDVTLDECLDMAAGKTAALLSCAASIGAELVGADHDLVLGLAEFGEHLGLAFQLVDDLLGIWGEPEVTGKPVLADLRARKKSLPVVAALRGTGVEVDELTRLYLNTPVLDERLLRRVAELVRLTGGYDWARDEADRQVIAARRCVEGLDAPAAVRDHLLQLAAFTTRRTW
ncbi:polyprenyl synthetase family protein [Lentzea sp. E54]|uniref:polyprenyl synthetase family protein n=1 Tax=Lentzea xerophila TaxID=3435883 RepID=UPI003DA457AD